MSIYLDLVRFLAAVAVFIAHLSTKPFTDGFVSWYFARFGDAAVIIFFVLSGYVIAHVVATRERRWESYAASRAARLYSVALVAAALTLLLDAVGQHIDPKFYEINKLIFKPPNLQDYAISIAFLNEWQIFRSDGVVMGTNGPWWSLSFEATYYLLAGLLLFLPIWVSVPVSVIILFAAGPTIAALSPLWLIGYLAYLTNTKINIKAAFSAFLFFFSGAFLVLLPYIAWRIPTVDVALQFGRPPFQRNIAIDYFVALFFSAHLLGAHGLSKIIPNVREPLSRIIRWLGSQTFPLYLIHFPVLCVAAAASPFEKNETAHALLISGVVALATTLVTPICDGLKPKLRAALAGGKSVHAKVR